jgi:IS6 family transposase
VRGFKQTSSARTIAGDAFVQNLRRGHYELAIDHVPHDRLPGAFAELAYCL